MSHPSKDFSVIYIPSIQVTFLKIQHFSITVHDQKGWLVAAQVWSFVFSCKTNSKHRIATEDLEQRTKLGRQAWDLEKVHILSIAQLGF